MLRGDRMKSSKHTIAVALVLVSLAVTQAAFAADATGSFSKTLSVSGNPDVQVTTGSGSINVHPGNTNSVIIDARIKANDSWGWGKHSNLSAQERVKRIEANPPVQQNGNSITIGKIEDEDLRNGVSISYDITVPAGTKLDSQTGSGSVEIGSLQGPLRAESGSGHIRVSKISNEVKLQTGSGGIELDGAEGNVNAHTGSGHIRLN